MEAHCATQPYRSGESGAYRAAFHGSESFPHRVRYFGMSNNVASSDSAEEPNPKDTDQPRDEAKVVASLEYVLAEANRQQDYRRHQIDTSVQLSMQLIGFASLTSPFTALATVHVECLKYVALFFLFGAVAIGLINIFNPSRSEDELPLEELRDEACIKSMQSVLLYQIDNKVGNEKRARTDEDKRIR